MISAQHALNDQLLIVLLSLVPGLPLLTGFALLFPPWRGPALKLAPWTALTAVLAALAVHPGLNLEVPWFFMGGRIGLDAVGRDFLLFTGLIWLLAALFGRDYLLQKQGAESRIHLFYFYYLVAMSGNFGLILAREILGFYLFFGLMSFAAYGLIIHERTPEAWRAGRIYIALVMIGEVFLFSALLLLVSGTESIQLYDVYHARASDITFLFFFLGFGIKAGALPLHFWLPLAHPAAPAPASAVLSGAMIKAGLLGWLRFLPLGLVDHHPAWWGLLFIVVGMVAAFYAVLIGITQTNAKTVLAYSSISQMGLMTALVGCGLLAVDNRALVISAVSFYAVHHGPAKAALFLGTALPCGRGAGRGGSPWWFWLALAGPCLALSGQPGSGGYLAKLGFKQVVQTLPPGPAGWLAWLLPLAAGGTALLLCHFFLVMKEKAVGEEDGAAAGEEGGSRSLARWWWVMVATAMILPWVWPLQIRVDRAFPAMAGGVGAMLPLVGGVAIGLFWGLKCKEKTGYYIYIPAGDVLAFFSWLRNQRRLLAMPALADYAGRTAGRVIRCLRATLAVKIEAAGQHLENIMKRWSVAGSCYAALLLILFFILTL